MTQFTDELVLCCMKELQLFGDGTEKEWMDNAYLEVGKYWTELAKIPQYAN